MVSILFWELQNEVDTIFLLGHFLISLFKTLLHFFHKYIYFLDKIYKKKYFYDRI